MPSQNLGVPFRDRWETEMRSPNGPLFKRYEILAVILFITAATALASFNLVY